MNKMYPPIIPYEVFKKQEEEEADERERSTTENLSGDSQEEKTPLAQKLLPKG